VTDAVRTVPELLGRLERESPHLEVFRDARRRLTAAEAASAVARLEHALRSTGLGPGERLLIVSENDVATPALVLAAQRLGAWPALINARVGVAEVEAMCQCAQPRLVVHAVEASPAAQALADTVATEEWDDPATGRLRWQRLSAAKVHDTGASDVALLLFTSGTTGRSKAVMWSHAGLIALGRVLAQTRATMPGAIVQCAGPLSHIMGIANMMAALAAGATLQLMPRLDTPALVAAVEAGEVTHLSLVPTAYRRICDHLESTGRTLAGKGLHYISCGGAPLDPALMQRVERLFGLRLVNGYGMTECAPGSRTRADREAAADCIGWPEPGVEMKVDAEAGEQVGELLIRSATRMVGYFGAPGETAAVIRGDGWMATGDLALPLPDGSFRLVGRRKDMIIRSGFNVYPAEVEAALQALPQVRQAAVVGSPGYDGEEEVVAFVCLHAGVQPDAGAIIAALHDRLAPYKRPARVEFVEEFPLGPTGKVAKQVLSARLAADAQPSARPPASASRAR